MSDEDVRALCLIRDCEWMTTVPGGPDAVGAATQLLIAHRENTHPHHQLQVQKCPLGCGWSLSAWSLPGEEYAEDRTRLQTEWSKHMVDEHPTVRGPGTIQVEMNLCPLDTASHDGREIASGALRELPAHGVPVVTERGEIVGRVSELSEEDGWLVAEGFLREDLVGEKDAAALWGGKTLPVSFAVMPRPHTIQGDRPFYVRDADLRNVRVSAGDEPVWEGTGLRATHPRLDAEEEPAEPAPKPSALDELAVKAAMQSLEAALRPLRDAMEAWAQTLMPAMVAFAQALAEHAKAIAVKPEPLIVPGPGFEDRIRTMTETVLGPRDWRYYVGVTTPPEGPQDWPRLPRDGKRAPTGCEVCEAPVDGRHPRDCPGA